MNIVVDTNIIFSAILNTKGTIGDLIFNSPPDFIFISPEFMRDEIFKHYEKLLILSKLND